MVIMKTFSRRCRPPFAFFSLCFLLSRATNSLLIGVLHFIQIISCNIACNLPKNIRFNLDLNQAFNLDC